MKKKNINNLMKHSSVRMGAVMLAAAIVFGGSMYAIDPVNHMEAPELVTMVDNEGSVEIQEEDTPLAKPKVTKSTKVTTKTKKTKLKKAATKTYSKKGKSTKKKSESTSKVGSITTTTETAVATSAVDKYKKGSKTKTTVTTTKTTITKTVVTSQVSVTNNINVSSATPSVNEIAPKVDSRVSNAFNTLGFKIMINSGVTYDGLFDARTRSITLKQSTTTVYHELGHFVAFLAGNIDKTAGFMQVYNAEKDLYTDYNKPYVLTSSSEYFAESFKNYTENPAALQASRPQTYAMIASSLAMITDARISMIQTAYSSVWQ
jgi:hypothetical protein